MSRPTPPDSVFEIVAWSWDLSDVTEYVAYWCENLEDAGDGVGTVFDLAAGLYWYCVDYHGGMGSEEYAILSSLDYSPGCGECSPGDYDGESPEDYEGQSYVYDCLVAANQTAL